MTFIITKVGNNLEKDLSLDMKLKRTGMSDEMIAQYHRYQDAGNRKGQERLLYRCRRLRSDKLKKNRETLSCLDFIIARVKNTQEISKSGYPI